ncbi:MULTISPECIES: YusU family protein [Paenibacillus]|uniref:YusU family protein n=1 Tax=Paenibacillus TaxID=44249 RepID=UPI00227E0CEE|nr:MULTISPECIES: YusU family protein [Paenibacillus]MCY7483547.1 YusU family protein [Paenibacillus alvei]
MNDNMTASFDALVEKYAELLTGHSDPATVEKVKMWALYNHMHKTMPNLTRHWNNANPEGKAGVRALFEEIKQMNEAHRADGGDQQ